MWRKRRQLLPITDVPRRFKHFIGDELKVVNLENPFDLGEEPSQEPEISAGHPYEAGDDLRVEFFIRKRNARRKFNAARVVLAL